MIPTSVTPRISDGRLTGYNYNDGANQRELALDKVWHNRYIDLARPYWGSGKLQKIAHWADTSGFVTDFLRVFFVNGTRFGGFIEAEEDSQERIALIKAGLANDHVGVSNAHKIGVLPKGSKWNGNDQSNVRFANLDCAELGTLQGERARRRMTELASGERLTCSLSVRRSYDRMVGECRLPDWRSISRVVVREGFCSRR